MHRASAFENPTAPLAHHTFDSTHIAMGVLTAGIETRPVAGRRLGLPRRRAGRAAMGPDGSRPARLVVGARLVPAERQWTLQVSHGFLNEPEAHEPGDVRRTTASASLDAQARAAAGRAATVAYGRNNKHRRRLQRRSSPRRRTRSARNCVLRTLRSRCRSRAIVLRFGAHSFVGRPRRRRTSPTNRRGPRHGRRAHARRRAHASRAREAGTSAPAPT